MAKIAVDTEAKITNVTITLTRDEALRLLAILGRQAGGPHGLSLYWPLRHKFVEMEGKYSQPYWADGSTFQLVSNEEGA